MLLKEKKKKGNTKNTKMESIVEENGNSALDPLADTSVSQQSNDGTLQNSSSSSAAGIGGPSGNTVLTTAANIVQFIPAQSIQVINKVQFCFQMPIKILLAFNLKLLTTFFRFIFFLLSTL